MMSYQHDVIDAGEWYYIDIVVDDIIIPRGSKICLPWNIVFLLATVDLLLLAVRDAALYWMRMGLQRPQSLADE